MTAHPRKARGTAKNRKPLYLEVDPVTVKKIAAMATALGRSKAATLDLILANTEIDDRAKPAWWDGPVASDLQKELPLTG